MIIWTPTVLSVLYACVLYFCICTCSAQLSMFYMERHSRNTLIIIIIIIITIIIIIIIIIIISCPPICATFPADMVIRLTQLLHSCLSQKLCKSAKVA